MMSELGATVFIVDDDEAVRDGLAELAGSVRLPAAIFATAHEFLEAYNPAQPGCLVLDVRLPGMSGLRLQEELLARRINLPIIFISGHGDLPMAVEAMKKGAFDFLEKPVGDQNLLDRINAALAEDERRRETRIARDQLESRFALLSPREREVLDLLKVGKSVNTIAKTLDISQKTAQVHRIHIIEKLRVTSVPELMSVLHRFDLL